MVLIKPCDIFSKKKKHFEKFRSDLKYMGVKVEVLDRMSVLEYIDMVKLVLFTDENEKCGTCELIGLMPNYRDIRYKNGECLTIGQPDVYDRTFIFCPCVVLGTFVEDKHMIESFLQAKCNSMGIRCKVVNLGCWDNADGTLREVVYE